MRTSRRDRQGGQVLIVFALLAVVIFGAGALALDAGSAMALRRDLQAYADTAALAGSREFTSSGHNDSNHADYVAMQYLSASLQSGSFSFPANGTSGGSPVTCSANTACPPGAYTVGSSQRFTITLSDPTAGILDVGLQQKQFNPLASILGYATTVSGQSGEAEAPAASAQGAGYALAALGGAAAMGGGGVISAPSGDSSGLVYTTTTYGGNNVPHTQQLPQYVCQTSSDLSACNACPGNIPARVDTNQTASWVSSNWGTGVAPYFQVKNQTNDNTPINPGVSAPGTFPNFRPVTTGPTFLSTNQSAAKDTRAGFVGDWMPGTYSGFSPSSGAMEPGVYVIQNDTSATLSLTGLTNLPSDTIPLGSEDDSGAVAIVLDSTDTGNITMSGTTLNGLDDLGTSNTPDEQGTHNFVIYGETFGGTWTENPAGSPTIKLSGLIDLPLVTLGLSGNYTWESFGSVYVKSFNLNGGGAAKQLFSWVCGLGAENPRGSPGNGLIR